MTWGEPPSSVVPRQSIPVLLGLTVRNEKVTSLQTLGLLAAGVAVVLLSVG